MDTPEQEDFISSDILKSGYPFCPFPEYRLADLPADILEWVEAKLNEGRPFVLRGFDKLDTWDPTVFNKKSLFELLSVTSILARNCRTGRDVRVSVQELVVSDESGREAKRRARELLYAKDLQCPRRWAQRLNFILPKPIRYLGSLDLFRALPRQIAPEVLMAYVGTRKSFSGFHRCFSGTVALNLLLEVEGTGPGTVCYGTDRQSQAKYDRFMETLDRFPHTDWTNVSLAQMKGADFPIYVYDQQPGDLVVFPSATAHQVCNVATSVTKVVWNILHISSVITFSREIQPAYQRQCHADTGRVPLVLINGLQDACKTSENYRSKEIATLAETFQLLVDDQTFEGEADVQVQSVNTRGGVIECNFCGSTIWDRHLHCTKCGDFDLCMTCFVSGRSCKHTSSYTWMQIHSSPVCNDLLERVWNLLGVFPRPLLPASSKSLGTLAVQAVLSRRDAKERLCHLCRDKHLLWKGIICDRCSSFFCFRGLFRHFDIEVIPLLRRRGPWACPKCSHICNCRCCHFLQPYQRKYRPARARVKAVDPRSSVYGFLDNVFDHKRGKRTTPASQSAPIASPGRQREQKRLRADNDSTVRPEDDIQSSGPVEYGNLDNGLEPSSSIPLVNMPAVSARAYPDAPQPVSGFDSTTRRTEGPVRINDLLVQREMSEPATQNLGPRQVETPSSSLAAMPSPSGRLSTVRGDTMTTPGPDSIHSLTNRLESLCNYANDLLELSLTDSHAQALDRIQQLQAKIKDVKRKKAEILFHNLRTNFPDLADVAMEEACRRGLAL